MKALKIVIMYTIAGILWITISDILFIKVEGITDYFIIATGSASATLFVLVTAVILHKLINLHYSRLQNSEQQYRSYFEDNPTPMWIYNRKTLKFTAVNNAAIHNYGYTREDFLNMTILDIRDPKDKDKVLTAVNDFDKSYKNSGVWAHRRKDGSEIYAHITSHLTILNEDQHVMIMANDVTKRLQTESALHLLNDELIKKNNMLSEIAWSQSHNVRKPLASILGLLNVIRSTTDEQERELCINYIEISASELDIMIYDLNNRISNAVYEE